MSVHQMRWPISSHSTPSPSVLPTSTTWTRVARTEFTASSTRIHEWLDGHAPGDEENVRDQLHGSRINLDTLVFDKFGKALIDRLVLAGEGVLPRGHGRTVPRPPAAAGCELQHTAV